MNELFPELVDKPKGHFFIEVGSDLYFCLVIRKHTTSLYQMEKKGLLSEENKKKVVQRLANFVEDDNRYDCHGDIKDN